MGADPTPRRSHYKAFVVAQVRLGRFELVHYIFMGDFLYISEWAEWVGLGS